MTHKKARNVDNVAPMMSGTPTPSSTSTLTNRHGLHGILNIGSTCYIAAVLQCIGHCPPLVTCIVREPPMGPVAETLRSFFIQKWRKHADMDSILNPRPIVEALHQDTARRGQSDTFQYLTQNDAHEFMIHLLTALESEYPSLRSSRSLETLNISTPRTISRKMKAHYAAGISTCPLTNRLYGQHTSLLKCNACSFTSPSFDIFLTLSVSLSNLESRVDKISQLLESEIECLEDYKCDKCGSHGSMRECHLSVGPQVLVIQVMRFQDDMHKNMRQIEIEETLQVHCATSMEKGDVYTYELNGIVCHSGSTQQGGHYYAICRHVDWVIFDDENVGTVRNIKNLSGADPYLLFYTRI